MSRTIRATPAHSLAVTARRASIPHDWRAQLAKREAMRTARHSRQARRVSQPHGYVAIRALFALALGALIAFRIWRSFGQVSAALSAALALIH